MSETQVHAWELWEQATERGDAVKLSQITGKSAEWYRSWGRRPASEDYPNGSGSISPVDTFIQTIRLLRGANPRSAQRLRQAVNQQLKDEERLFGQTHPAMPFPGQTLWQVLHAKLTEVSYTEQVRLIDQAIADLESYRNGLRLDDIEDAPRPKVVNG